MKVIVLNLLCILVFSGCASTIVELRGHTDFNPIYDWSSSMKIFVLPEQGPEIPLNSYRIEAKLTRIIQLSSNKTGLRIVEDPEVADGFMMVKYRLDSLSYITPAFSQSFGNSTLWRNQLTKQLGTVSYDYTVTTPSYEVEKKFIRVELWFIENPLNDKRVTGETETHMVSSASSELNDDGNRLTYNLLVACLKSIPGVDQKFESKTPVIEAVLEMNWLSGVKTRNVDNAGYTIYGLAPFVWDDIIYEIDGMRIFDYFDYKAAMLSIPENSKSCKIKFNRGGSQSELEYRF